MWASQLQHEKGLATPVTASPFVEVQEMNDPRVVQSSSMKIMFRPPKRSLSFSEQRDLEKGVLPDRKGAKQDAWSPGGIEVLVQTAGIKGSVDEEVKLVARRCGIDGDTIIKLTSERAIVRRLDEAVRVWKRVRQLK